jgi:hypothetical protein
VASSAVKVSQSRVDPVDRVDRDPGQRVRPLDGQLLDLHPALDRGHRQVRPVGPVEQVGHVVLGVDVAGLGDQDPAYQVALDVQAEDRRRLLRGLVGVGRQLDAAGLAPAPGLDLGLHHHGGADPAGGDPRLLGGVGHLPRQHGYAVRGEELLRLVLVQVHEFIPPRRGHHRPRAPRSRREGIHRW